MPKKKAQDINGDPHDDVHLAAIRAALDRYRKDHPKAKVDAYRRGDFIVRARIIDPDLKKLDRLQRDDLAWKYLDSLSTATVNHLSLLVLIAPDETERSGSNYAFEHPELLDIE